MRTYVKLFVVALLVILVPLIAVAASNSLARPAEAAPLSHSDGEPSDQKWFAKYDGIEGESDGSDTTRSGNHLMWIDILSIDWGSHKPGDGATGQSRRRGGVIVGDMTLTMEYEKSTVKLLEKLNMGEVIPKLEIEQTATYGGSRATYLKYELTNVQVTSFAVNGATDDDSPPMVTISNNFEEYKVTYTEHNETGGPTGTVEARWKIIETHK
jgi:type VI secretion system Hcp family effector